MAKIFDCACIVRIDGKKFVQTKTLLSMSPKVKVALYRVEETRGNPYTVCWPSAGDSVLSPPAFSATREWQTISPNDRESGYVQVEKEPTSTTLEPFPCPKVKEGTVTRWNDVDRQWEKLLKSGWRALPQAIK